MTERRPPNVLFILGDDWGWGDLGCFGHPVARTPNLDQLAREGSRFTQFYVGSPVCSASRASFLTGRFPATCGVHHIFGGTEDNRRRGMPDFLGQDYPTVSSLLRSVGYRTAHFGKWHLGASPDAPDPGCYGFDTHASLLSTGPSLWDDFKRSPTDHPVSPIAEFQPHSSRIMVDHAIDWLHRVGDEPFYLQLWLLDPHAILNPTDEQLAPYAELSPSGVDHVGAMSIYYSVLTNADRHLGRLFAALDELGLADDTLVIFTGDNGPEDTYVPNASHSAAGSAGPFRGRKRSLYEGGIRMPLIARWPGRIPAGQVDDSAVIASIDVLPTLCSLAGVDAPGSDGEDVSAVLEGSPSPRKRPLYWEYRFPNGSHPIHCSPSLAVRSGNWKLLLNPDQSRVELYDIPNDSMELENRAETHPDLVQQLSTLALDWAGRLPDGPRHRDAGSNDYRWPTPGTEAIPQAAWKAGW